MVASDEELLLPCVTPELVLELSLLEPVELELSLLPVEFELSLLPLELLPELPLVVLPLVLVLVPVSLVPCSCPIHTPAPVTIATTRPPRLTRELVVLNLFVKPIVPPRPS
ncbi:hypothetical protein Csp2054_07640 [Curtobacterium sp. 'Ferrero']|uniref:hypothetical protein n=1 Tax=Curtobacterium sp. 'Ferrero' TaxID=2033654 RepID=UPI000BD9AFAF|nr:hypothetical protein [Curtobacterium sp. 'Ferrero']PCN48284.1 hypothetical protein Csp2054_07640 [Curtobacterium sp. 'Ferrero']